VALVFAPAHGGLFHVLLSRIVGRDLRRARADPADRRRPVRRAGGLLRAGLSRHGRHRDDSRFEKLATTPLGRAEWLVAHTLVNIAIIGLASLLILGLVVALTGAVIPLTPRLALLAPFTVAAVVLFCGFGAILGRLSSTQDGVIAASNTIAFPLLFLSDTFVTLDQLPGWFAPLVDLSPLTYFARGVRAVTTGEPAIPALGVLAVLAVIFFVAGAYAIPRTD
jgi:ABC-2 type transport system permease protein